MDTTKFLVLFYKEQHYVFGVCPCCNKIFQLTDTVVSIENKRITLPEMDGILKKQRQADRDQENLDSLQESFYEKQQGLLSRQEQYAEVEPVIVRKVRIEGRRQALNRIKKIDRVFSKRNIDPRDIRLLFSPVEFIAFPGMTDDDNFREISFFAKRPRSRTEEKVTNSIRHTIKSGNLEFVLIRIDDNGKVTYER